MFYSLSDWEKDFAPSCIWRATATGEYPNKKWVEDEEPVVCVNAVDLEESGAPYAIDPSTFRCKMNRPWLLFGSHFSGIYLVELDSNNTGKMLNANGYFYSDNEDLFTNLAKGPPMEEAEELGVEFTSIEAAYMYFDREASMYYLFANWGKCCDGVDSTYKIVVGRCPTIYGPYEDMNGESMLDVGGTIVLDTKPEGGDRIVGPGHAGVFKGGLTNDDKDYFSFHFYDTENNGVGTLGTFQLNWSEDGWPTVDLTKPMLPEATAVGSSGAAQLLTLNLTALLYTYFF